MPKIKVPRKSTHMDMTAMCDVGFLLLTFFILTAKFRPNELVEIVTPASRATETVKDDLVTISVDKIGNVYYVASSPRRKADILEKMIEKYGTKYTMLGSLNAKQKAQFTQLEQIAFPAQAIPQMVGLKQNQLKEMQSKGQLTGVPKDSTNNELGDWIMATRFAYGDDKITFAIKGDKTSNIVAIKRVIDVLREKDVNSFKLVTALEGNKD
ncbi:MAG TPA: biopolymer transporter ExbD [Chitinophagales bacterium]|nr:biopolymer transporter ExbD [Chitinophagales bacterium]